MRYILIFLLPFLGFAQIPSAAGNGITDDTAALQAWLDSGSSHLPVGTETYRITAQLDIDQNGAQTVDFNGATITVTSALSIYAIIIDKPDRATTTISNLLIDGDVKLRNGISVDSPIQATNVDIKDLYSATQTVIGWRLYIDANNYGTFNFNGCDVYDVHSLSNGITGDNAGSARAMDVGWYANPPQTTIITYENFIWDGCYGEDGGPIRIDDNAAGVEFSETTHKTVLRNGVIKDFIRRGTKVGCDNSEFYNIEWTYALATDPLYENNPAGIVGVRPTASDPNGALNNIVYDGCTFNNTSYQWAIIDSMDGVTISNCTFNDGAGIRIDNSSDSFMGDWSICNTVFSATSSIIDQNIGTGAGTGQLAGTTLSYDTDNSRTAASVITFNNTNVATPYSYAVSDLVCAVVPPADPGILGGKSKRSFFKLIN